MRKQTERWFREITDDIWGNPLACAAVNAVFDQFEEKKIPEHAKKVGQYLWDQLEALKNEFCTIIGHRGLGLMQGLEFAPGKISR